VRILLRADSGFCREALMAWCEQNRVDFVFGLARNARLVAEIAVELRQAEAEAEATATGKPARRFKDFPYATLDSWSRRRRVIGKAEWTEGEANPRFIVTSLTKAGTNGRFLYEKVYCARGEMENRIKECQGDLFADRTSTATLRANQLQAVACLIRLRPHLRDPARRPRPHPVRRRDLRHDQAQAPQARRPRPHQRAPHQVRPRLGVSLRRRVAPRRRPPRHNRLRRRRNAENRGNLPLVPPETRKKADTIGANSATDALDHHTDAATMLAGPSAGRAEFEKCGLAMTEGGGRNSFHPALEPRPSPSNRQSTKYAPHNFAIAGTLVT
jgi:hypothetical protein